MFKQKFLESDASDTQYQLRKKTIIFITAKVSETDPK